MSQTPSIDQYLLSTCLFIIDEFNDRYKDLNNEELKLVAKNEFTETDIVVRLGFPFKQMANFPLQGKKGNDIVVKSKEFCVEVKYLKSLKSGNTINNAVPWKQIDKDFIWIKEEINGDRKGKSAFVIGWFNYTDRFSEIIQIGEGEGAYPKINKERYDLFPFINRTGDLTKDIYYMYNLAYIKQSRNIPNSSHVLDCIFLGQPSDKFHFAIYY